MVGTPHPYKSTFFRFRIFLSRSLTTSTPNLGSLFYQGPDAKIGRKVIRHDGEVLTNPKKGRNSVATEVSY